VKVPEREVARLKHERIAEVLAREIRRGRLGYGERLPGESALAQRFSVSRNTVRAALSELGDAGLITTRSGKGSFVTFDGQRLDDRHGWAQALRDRGAELTVTVLRCERVHDVGLARRLGVPGPAFLAVDRVRATDLLWTLNHPDTWYLLVRRCGWTADQYEQWVGDTLTAQLLAS